LGEATYRPTRKKLQQQKYVDELMLSDNNMERREDKPNEPQQDYKEGHHFEDQYKCH
jgi:hypothetical protein